jgi:hypothetical protein
MYIGKLRKFVPKSTFAHAGGACVFVYLWLLLSACGGNSTIPPNPSLPAIFPSEVIIPTLPVVSTVIQSCIDSLIFINDITIPDNSIVTPGSMVDKQWLVQNDGSCNWDGRYRLRLIYGDSLGTTPELALFPARAGMQATIRIVFTAPLEAGEYISEWKAFDSRGIPFGESFLMKIVVN